TVGQAASGVDVRQNEAVRADEPLAEAPRACDHVFQRGYCYDGSVNKAIRRLDPHSSTQPVHTFRDPAWCWQGCTPFRGMTSTRTGCRVFARPIATAHAHGCRNERIRGPPAARALVCFRLPPAQITMSPTNSR